ncbi:MAG: hypothetical protein KC431_04360, partial [Myxococcales bacterium]|nr:hypothetical protein [Myxococcales bacterium]
LRTRQLALQSVAAEAMPLELGQAAHRGPLLRQQFFARYYKEGGEGDLRPHVLAATSAVRGLEPEVAILHGQHVVNWLAAAEAERVRLEERAEARERAKALARGESKDDETPKDEDGEDEPVYIAHAPWMLDRVSLVDETGEDELKAIALFATTLAELVRDDLAAGRIDAVAMAELIDLHVQEHAGAEIAAVVDAHPESHVGKYFLLLEQRARREPEAEEQARILARELLRLEPDSPLVLVDALPLLTGPDDVEDARSVLAQARAHNGDHLWLSDAVLPAILTGADDGLPDWIRSPEAFDTRIAALDPAGLEALEPKRWAMVEASAELFVPAAAALVEEGRLSFTVPIPGHEAAGDGDDGEVPVREQWVARVHRDTRCEGMDCAESFLAAWANNGYELVWARELEILGGPAVEFVLRRRDRVAHTLLIPTGGSLFGLMSRTLPEDLEGMLPQIALGRIGVRPLDWSVAAKTAEDLRAGNRMPDDELRLRGRTALSAVTGDLCPLKTGGSDLLAGLDAAQQGGLLLDLLLATREPAQRRALLRCTNAKA